MKHEINKPLTKGITKETCHEEKEFVSPSFIFHKSNDRVRIILNLKQLNKNIEFNINTILNLFTKDCFMASIDWKDAYYIARIFEIFQRYLKFDHTSEVCVNNVMSITELFDRLGIVAHPDKFVPIPAQEISILEKNVNKTDTTKRKESRKISKSAIFYEKPINQVFGQSTK